MANVPANRAVFPRRIMSLRSKLTLWMLVIAAVIQLSLALILLLYQGHSITAIINQRLATRVSLAATQIADRVDSINDTDLSAMVAAHQAAILPSILSFTLINERGEVAASSSRSTAAIDKAIVDHVLADEQMAFVSLPPPPASDLSSDGHRRRMAAMQIRGSSGARYVFTMVSTDVFVESVIPLLNHAVLLTILIGTVATGIAAYLISGIAVRPLIHIADAAKRLAPESIGTHFDASPMPAEVLHVREELEKARVRIEAGFQTQERFMSNVSHELKTPIATILTELQTVNLDSVPPQVREMLRSQSEELEKLAQMVDSFLLLTRVRNGKLKAPTSARCLVRDVLFETFVSCSPFAKQHKVRIDLQLPGDEHVDATVVGNCDLLRVIFDNIIRNAIRFSPAQAIVSVKAWVNAGMLHVTVRDRGSGIPSELLPRIFDRFAQATDEQRRGRGHGLGLEIAMGLAELHTGGIRVRNCDDGGCEFEVHLPIASTGADGA